MYFLTCPECGSEYERHPLNPAAQELCPVCRNGVSWDSIKAVLARAAGSSGLTTNSADPEHDASRAVAASTGSVAVSKEQGGHSFENVGKSAIFARLAACLERDNPFAPRVSASELADYGGVLSTPLRLIMGLGSVGGADTIVQPLSAPEAGGEPAHKFEPSFQIAVAPLPVQAADACGG